MLIGRIGLDFITNTEFFSRQQAPSTTALADGRFVVAWTSFDDGDGSIGCVRARVFNADGTPADEDFIVNTTAAGAQDSIAIAALPDGRFVAAWSSADPGDGSGRCIRLRLFTADGEGADIDFLANSTATDAQTTPTVTGLPNGRIVVTWASNDTGDGSAGCIRGRVFAADGTALGNDFVFNTTAASAQALPAISALADGRFVVVWTSNDTADGSGACVRARIFSGDGVPAANDFIVNTTTTGSQYLSVVSSLPNGGFVAAWYSEDPGDGSLGCIRARIFNAGGGAPANDFIVNTVATGSQLDPAIATLPDGRFIVAWSSDDTGDGSGSCIRARLYNADGSAAGNDFIVNTSAANGQAAPSVTSLGDGRFIVSWESDDGGEGSSALLGSCIRTQIFDANKFVGTVGEDTWYGSNLFGDVISGGGSADTLFGLGGDDTINGDAGADTLNGGDGNDRLFGGADADTLDGGAGADTMFGGRDNDTYIVDNAGDVVNETGGTGIDTVKSSISFSLAASSQVVGEVENLTLTGSAAISGTGNALANVLDGSQNTAANVLRGLGGSDTYFVGAGDSVIEAVGGGDDTIYARVSFTLAAGQEVEKISTVSQGATTAINLIGNEFAQLIIGNAGSNQLGDGGGAGADTLRGLGGDDSYFVRTAGTVILESSSGGANDSVAAAVSYALGAGVYVERLATISQGATTAINLTGNEIAQMIVGNQGSNVLSGKGGNDTLTGGAGQDTFAFDTAPNTASNSDKITDFVSVDDTIQLAKSVFAAIIGNGTLSANQFHASATGVAHDLDDRIIYNTATGALIYDQNGSNPGGALQFATLTTRPTIDATDFFLV